MVRFVVALQLFTLGAALQHVDQNIGKATLRGRTSQFARHLRQKRAKIQRRLNKENALPVQTFYIPLPEEDILDNMFKTINKIADGPVESMVSIAVSTDNTVVWYDHWEDGYEDDVVHPSKDSTQVWGDGLASTGCAPHIPPSQCTDEADRLKAGDTFIIQNSVPRMADRKKTDAFGVEYTEAKYDGGDRLQASFPIAVTRGSFPHSPGSQMAGAVEVLDDRKWGTEYVAPAGSNMVQNVHTGNTEMAFEYSAFYIMAGRFESTVTLHNGTQVVLPPGQGTMVNVKLGDTISASTPVQVDLITGDIDSSYQLRWFSLLPVSEWSNEYVSPVGDTHGYTLMMLYNHNDSDLHVKMTSRKDITNYDLVASLYEYTNYTAAIAADANADVSLSSAAKKHTGLTFNEAMDMASERNWTAKYDNIVVKAKNYARTPVVPTGSGANLKADGDFIALSVTDSGLWVGDFGKGDMQITLGQWYDWGFPVLPLENLTPQVVVGLGYGCTNNKCSGHDERSVVWVTTTEDAILRVSRDNNEVYEDIVMDALECVRLEDDKDQDMSGAFMYATTRDGTDLVNIAAAWGQDPKRSKDLQSISLDLGTVVLPFAQVEAYKLADKQSVEVGDTLEYTIRIANVGQEYLQGGTIKLFDTLDANMEYIPGTAVVRPLGADDSTPIDEDLDGATLFPLDEGGFTLNVDLERRGGVADVIFSVRVLSVHDIPDGTLFVTNNGRIKHPGGEVDFQLMTPVTYTANINVTNVVYLGDTPSDESCSVAGESVTAVNGTSVIYCFNVTNTGSIPLNNIELSNGDLDYSHPGSTDTVLQPGESLLFTLNSTIAGNLTNNVVVTGNPIDDDGNDLNVEDVTAEDPSGVLEESNPGDVRNGDKPPYSPPEEDPDTDNCAQDAYDDNGGSTLSCTNEKVTVQSLSAEPATCSAGSTITLTVDGTFKFKEGVNDFGWYVSKDGGDALQGSCVVNGLQEQYSYSLQSADGFTDPDAVGMVNWDYDSDPCGDVIIVNEEDGFVSTPLLVQQNITCSDDNDDGKLDVTVCFVWKPQGSPEVCTLTSDHKDTVGSLADITPGDTDLCNCQTYDIPDIKVDKPVEVC